MQSSLLEILEQSLRTVGTQGRKAFSCTAFDLFISEQATYHMSFAVPKAMQPRDWAAAIQEMQAIFTQQDRCARLEYFHECHPDLAIALEQAGFQQDMQAPVMALSKNAFTAEASSLGDYQRLEYGQLDALKTYLRRQSLAYGGLGDDSALGWLEPLNEGLKQGSHMVAALKVKGEIVSGASIQIGESIGELAGVWTLPSYQKQGFAYALCQRLVSDYFQAGYDLCWLSAAEGAQRLYKHLGFNTIGTQLNYGLPDFKS